MVCNPRKYISETLLTQVVVATNCNLTVDLSVIPKAQFVEAMGAEGKIIKLHYKLIIRLKGAQMAFSFECGGKEYASVKADY